MRKNENRGCLSGAVLLLIQFIMILVRLFLRDYIRISWGIILIPLWLVIGILAYAVIVGITITIVDSVRSENEKNRKTDQRSGSSSSSE